MPSSGDSDQRGLLAIHPGALGDVVLLGRLLQLLGLPATVVAAGSKGGLLVEAGVARRAIDFDSLAMHEVFADSPLREGRLAGQLGGFGSLVSCFAEGDAGAQSRLVEACGNPASTFLPVRPPAGYSGHLVELWCELLEIDWPGRDGFAPWNLHALPRDQSGDSALPGSPVVIHPGAGGVYKHWPMQRFLEVAQWLRDEGCRDVIVALGPAELERLAGGQVEALRRDWQVLEAPPLEELAGLVARAGAMVGNDSGPSHLAAAMGCPVVAVFGPTSPAHFAPLGKEVQICQGSRIEDVPVSAVTDAVSQLLGR